MPVADTSKMARALCEKRGITEKQKRKIIATLMDSDPLTRRELSVKSGISIPSVCGAVHPLVKCGLIKEWSPRPCRVTGWMAHPLSIAEVQPTAPLEPTPEQGTLI